MLLAHIREMDCVGCAKCLPACPVDAIVGSAQFLHGVLTDQCIGCGLCVAPCPMDCIEMVVHPIQEGSQEKLELAQKAKIWFAEKRKRQLRDAPLRLQNTANAPDLKAKIQLEIQEAVSRVNAKRTTLSEQC